MISANTVLTTEQSKEPKVQILKDSLHPNGRNRFTTFLIDFPKCLLAELNTHRQLCRNVGSARAIPVHKMIDKAKSEPFIPVFTRNQAGMSGKQDLSSNEIILAEQIWLDALESAVTRAEMLRSVGIHKEGTNRLLEPFLTVKVLLSGTEFEHFFRLRCHPSAQLSFKVIADEMQSLYLKNTPNQLNYGEWHIPFDAYFPENTSLYEKLCISTARHARLSYENHGGDHTPEKDFKLFQDLVSQKHMTPLEHCAKVVDNEQDIVLNAEGTTVNVRSFLPQNLQDYLFINDTNIRGELLPIDNRFRWSRQYAGFYTFRSHLEDGVEVA